MKKLVLPFLAVLLFTACQKQINKEQITPQAAAENSDAASKGGSNKIDVCHKAGPNNWHKINISINALPAHLAHGDIVPDTDGDGYTKVNPCGNGNQDDCDDNNDAIHPGAAEICGNNIDDNCNGYIDENCTTTVNICDQTWMIKNLDVDKYRDGSTILHATTQAEWIAASNSETGAWCYQSHIPAYGAIYGKLYNWYAVNDPRGLAPAGWHVPSDEEWTTLENCLDAILPTGNVGGKMKETGTTHWLSPNTEATNSSGWTGLPGGAVNYGGQFLNLFARGYWWSSTEYNTTEALNRQIDYPSGSFDLGVNFKGLGASVRCLRD